MTTASMSSDALAQVVKSGSTRSIPICSAVGKRRPAVDDHDAAVVLDDRQVLADLADAPSGGRAGPLTWTGTLPASRPWRSSMARTASVSASSASTIGAGRRRRGQQVQPPSYGFGLAVMNIVA